MGNDEFFYKKREKRKKRETDILDLRPNNWLIVTEGTKTEPIYFKLLIDKINNKLPKHARLCCDIYGQGKNTVSLVKSVENLEYVIDKYINKKIIKYDKIFVVFDKDSFSDKLFTDAIKLCEKNKYIPLWSNESLELWFLLHFNYYDNQMDRHAYIKKLDEELKKCKSNLSYNKNDNKCLSYIIENKCLIFAIKNAKKKYNQMIENKIKPVNANGVTTIFNFFDIIDDRNKELDTLPISKIFN